MRVHPLLVFCQTGRPNSFGSLAEGGFQRKGGGRKGRKELLSVASTACSKSLRPGVFATLRCFLAANRLVSEYLRQLTTPNDPLADAPIVRRLSGMLPQDVSVEDYREHLERRHGREV